MTTLRQMNIALLGGDKALRSLVRGALPKAQPLEFLDDILSVLGLDSSYTLIIPEVLQEGSSLELVRLLKQHHSSCPRIFFLAVDHLRREEAFAAGVDDYLALPLAKECSRKFSLAPVISPAALSGKIAIFSAINLIQFLFSSAATGKLKIYGKEEFELWFQEGELIEARCDFAEGEQAVLYILKNSAAQTDFEFITLQSVSIPRNIVRRTDHLLLYLASILDEQQL